MVVVTAQQSGPAYPASVTAAVNTVNAMFILQYIRYMAVALHQSSRQLGSGKNWPMYTTVS